MKPTTTQNFNKILKTSESQNKKLSPLLRELPQEKNNDI